MPTIACLMEKSVISVTQQYVEPCLLFSIIVGFPSSKKSVCMNFVKDQFILATNIVNLGLLEGDKKSFKPFNTNNSKEIKFFQKFIDSFKINLTGFTIESLVEALNEQSSVIQYHDEFTRLVSSFGLYKWGGGGSSFDKAQYLTLYNGENNFQYKTRAYEYNIKRPR